MMKFQLEIPECPTEPMEPMDLDALQAELEQLTEACGEVDRLMLRLYQAKDKYMDRRSSLKYRMFNLRRPEDELAHALREWYSPMSGVWRMSIEGRGPRLQGSYAVVRREDGTVEFSSDKPTSKGSQLFDSDKDALRHLKDYFPKDMVKVYGEYFYDQEYMDYVEDRRGRR